ncbi:MAG: exopolysaccharide production protein ExoZ [Bradyrhizobium sp.]|jgi:exopolysaccharide production protein ExoZ|nr:exopolysaccharide production protein ExoZ [Bradyrhizobium sp.]
MLVHIQILRFFAALAVVAFHALGLAPKGFELPESVVSLALSYGGRGVDLFFVISGFIIFYTSQSATLTPASFLRRRSERIVPLYFFVIFTFILLAMTLPANFATPGWYTPRHILKSLAFISFTDGEPPVIAVGWSLEYEMYFYLAVALLMALTREVWRNTVLIFSALAIFGQLPGVSAALGNYAFFTDPMIMEFVLGVIAGQLFVHGRIGLPVLIATGCAFAAVLLGDPFNRAIVAGIPAACLVAAAAFVSRRRILASWPERALARLGDASYSIYLAQVETVALAAVAVAKLLPSIAPMLLLTVTSCIVVALGLLLNILVERPLLEFCRGFRSARVPQPVPAEISRPSQPLPAA